jgi:drug/metabolite transporter (DMT)-like permease
LRNTACVAIAARQELPTSGRDYSIGGEEVNAIKMLAVVLIVAGVLGLVYGGFSYTKETHEATVGPIQLTLKDKKTVNIPVWAGVGAIAIGGVLLLFGGRKS